ncbi:hypothetical protein MRB53_019545 [Persea americana]|uniref:Uncharacterized protein n=1 Tax=Persea americana TaxID=3435 RepID=A0ACC2KYN8_PERAE|nr:hypothetical protein MRB53_019545 [Persea americana]
MQEGQFRIEASCHQHLFRQDPILFCLLFPSDKTLFSFVPHSTEMVGKNELGPLTSYQARLRGQTKMGIALWCLGPLFKVGQDGHQRN